MNVYCRLDYINLHYTWINLDYIHVYKNCVCEELDLNLVRKQLENRHEHN
jgi:hypothetical protein